MALTLARDEVFWLFKHNSVNAPKGKHRPNPDDYNDPTLPELIFQIVELKGIYTPFVPQGRREGGREGGRKVEGREGGGRWKGGGREVEGREGGGREGGREVEGRAVEGREGMMV